MKLSDISKKLREGADFLDSLPMLERKLTDFLYKAKETIETELKKESNHKD